MAKDLGLECVIDGIVDILKVKVQGVAFVCRSIAAKSFLRLKWRA